MKVQFKESFAKDLQKVSDIALRTRIKALIHTVEEAEDLTSIPHIKRLQGGGHYYRVRIGDYRVGLIANEVEVTFVRFLHRRDIYRRFP